MSSKETKQSWLEPVSIKRVEDYILKKFPDAIDIDVIDKYNKYFATFTIVEDPFDEEDFSIMLTDFTTSIDGFELDKEWINIVRECNEGRTIDGWTYEQDLVRKLEVMIYNKKNDAIRKAEEEYKQDVDFLNDLFKELKIEEEIEPRQI